MLNRIILSGRLTRDPELRRTQSGIPVASFSLAVNRDFKDKATGETPVDFIDIVAWRHTGEFAANYFAKGSMAVVEGRLQIRDWTDREGGNGLAHGLIGSLKDIDLVNPLLRGQTDANCQRLLLNLSGKLLPLFCGQLLGIVDVQNPAVLRQNHRGSHHRPGQRPPAHLVDAAQGAALSVPALIDTHAFQPFTLCLQFFLAPLLSLLTQKLCLCHFSFCSSPADKIPAA